LQFISSVESLQTAIEVGSADVSRGAYESIDRSQGLAAHPIPHPSRCQKPQRSEHQQIVTKQLQGFDGVIGRSNRYDSICVSIDVELRDGKADILSLNVPRSENGLIPRNGEHWHLLLHLRKLGTVHGLPALVINLKIVARMFMPIDRGQLVGDLRWRHAVPLC